MDGLTTLRRGVAALLVAIGLAAGCTSGGEPTLGPVTRLSEPEHGAAVFSWPYYTSLLARDDGVIAAYMILSGTKNRSVAVRRSTDGGSTWSPQFALNAEGYDGTISVTPKLAFVGGDSVLAVWQSRRNEAGQKFVVARRSNDFAATWQPPVQLNSVAQSFSPAIAARPDGFAFVAFSDERNTARDIFVNRSVDGGVTWLTNDVAVDSAERTESTAPAVAVGQGQDAYVIWEEKGRGAPRLLFGRSGDGGQTWAPVRRVDPENGPASPIWPALVESGGRLTAVWTAGLIADTTKSWLWVSSSTDKGETWSTPQLFYEGGIQTFFQVISVGSRLYLAWSGGARATVGGIYLNVSDDGGATWRQPLDQPLRIDDGAGATGVPAQPRIAATDDGLVAITWQEDNKRIAVKLSADFGRTWPAQSSTIATSDKNRLRFPQVALGRRQAYVLWEEWTDASPQRKTLADVEKLSPVDVFVRSVAR
jgi:hypothetical protein